MISAEEILILKDQPIPTWTDLLDKLSLHWLPHWDSMVLLMLISPNSKPTWFPIQEFTLCCHHTHQSSPLKKLIMNNWLLLKSPTPVLNQPTWWSNVTQDTENIWLVPWCTEEMLSPRTSTQPLPPSRPREPSNSLIGVPPDSRLESTINHQPLSQEEIWLKLWEQFAWFPTLPQLLKSSQDSIINSI